MAFLLATDPLTMAIVAAIFGAIAYLVRYFAAKTAPKQFVTRCQKCQQWYEDPAPAACVVCGSKDLQKEEIRDQEK